MTEPNPGPAEDIIPEPDNTYGRVLYDGLNRRFLGASPGATFDEWDHDIRSGFVEVAREVIRAYDDYLTGKADAYAVAVAEAPTFTDHLQAAMEADDAAKMGT